MTQSEKISVLMAVYAGEKPDRFDEALESLWTSQTVRPGQIVLVEDGPLTAALDQVLEKWMAIMGHDVLDLVRNDHNMGLAPSLNRGLKSVKGIYVARMDSDDRSHPRRLELQSLYLDSHPEVSILGGSIQEFDKDHECLLVRHYPETPQRSRAMIHRGLPLAHPTVMMRRAMFDAGLAYKERENKTEDIALWYDALDAGYGIASLPEVTLYFRRDHQTCGRRGREGNAYNEMADYMRGIRRLDGLWSWKYIFPMARYVFRMLPVSWVNAIYSSPLRDKLLR